MGLPAAVEDVTHAVAVDDVVANMLPAIPHHVNEELMMCLILFTFKASAQDTKAVAEIECAEEIVLGVGGDLATCLPQRVQAAMFRAADTASSFPSAGRARLRDKRCEYVLGSEMEVLGAEGVVVDPVADFAW